MGEDFSVAWRVFDSQHWGVPQRRKRIYLVADFAGQGASKVLFESDGLSGYSAEGIRAWQSAARCAEDGSGTAGGSLKWCVNPQGCSGVTVTEDSVGTLVAEDHGHHPAVAQSAGFCTEHSAKARSIGYEQEMSPTLRAGIVPATVYENHGMDARYKGPLEVAQPITATYGMGGNNQPLVVDGEAKPVTLKIRCGKEGGGKGALMQNDKSATIATNNDQTLFQPVGFDRYNGDLTGNVSQTLNACAGSSGNNQPMVFEPEYKAYGICSKSSHAMLSDNPNSGFYEAETSRTLDQSGGNAVTSNQGGICVVAPDPAYALQGSMIGRQEKNGPQGDGVNEDVSFTLNTADKHAVAQPTYSSTVGSFMSSSEETAQTLMARDYKDPQIVNASQPGEPMYIVRRLTPVECARLQGFPDWWCMGLETPDPTEEDIAFWTEVFETHRRLTNPKGKPKPRNKIIKWLQHPYTDSAEYKLWGNGICLNNGYFVLAGIVWADGLNN